MKKILPIAIIAIIVLGAGAFYGGIKFAEAKKPALGQFGNFQGQRGAAAGPDAVGAARKGMAGQGQGQGGGFINGDIINADATSVTIKLRDGGSKIAFFSTSTEVGKFVIGSVSDLTVGTNVMVTGKANADGSVIAQSIQIRPAGMQPAGAPRK